MSNSHATHERKGIWYADLASIILLTVFVLIIYGIEALVQPAFSQTGLLLTGVVLAVVPALVWLAFFYRRDRREPEPKGMVFQLFVLGALLANAIGIPLVDNVFGVPDWLRSNSVWGQLIAGTLIVGFVQEFLKYAAVRFSVYTSHEFDEPTDGIIYTTAAGLGYATMLNINFVVSSGGIDLGNGAIRIVLTALAHASFAGIVGYFLGRQKLESRPIWWMPVGLLLAAFLNSLFFYLRGTLSQGSFGGSANTWVGLLLAAVLAGGVTFFLSRTIHQQVEMQIAQEAK